ncbi:tryptophan-rich sensory protein [Euryarchaeota archaeon]|nr:tryptophan-rich sensory protein [Euryarchaeota archaeon]
MTFNSEYKPFFQPPGWIIGPIWAVLYTTLAVSIFLALTNRDKIDNKMLVFGFFLIQIALNLMWPDVFNSARYLLSLIMIVLMTLFSILYAVFIYESVPVASKLVWPYIAWIAFASIINVAYYLEFR